jgi:DnaJ domain
MFLLLSSRRSSSVLSRIQRCTSSSSCSITKPMTFRSRVVVVVPVAVVATGPQVLLSQQRSYYFTNAQRVKGEDPYAVLGLQWGARTSDIKAAFRQKAAVLHPDVNTTDPPQAALRKFQTLTAAYETLTKTTLRLPLLPVLDEDEWQWSVFVRGDRIASERTDVAGQARARPMPPASVDGNPQKFTLGHPAGLGSRTARRGEYLSRTSNSSDSKQQQQPVSSSVGRGHNKWVEPRPYQPWTTTATQQHHHHTRRRTASSASPPPPLKAFSSSAGNNNDNNNAHEPQATTAQTTTPLV